MADNGRDTCIICACLVRGIECDQYLVLVYRFANKIFLGLPLTHQAPSGELFAKTYFFSFNLNRNFLNRFLVWQNNANNLLSSLWTSSWPTFSLKELMSLRLWQPSNIPFNFLELLQYT